METSGLLARGRRSCDAPGVKPHPPDEASLLAHLVAAALVRPERARGRFALRSGGAVAYLVDGVVGDAAPDRLDAQIEAPLSVLTELLSGAGPVAAWLGGRLRLRGSIFKALGLLGAFRR